MKKPSGRKRLAVFCGSRTGNHPAYANAARQLAAAMAAANCDLVYGGGRVGLMGVLADELLHLGGQAYGVIPEKLHDMEVAHRALTELYVVDTMHERKAMMAQMADGFIAMAGGIGTLEEIIEVFTWQQIGYHSKPCAFLNTNSYYSPLLEMINCMVKENFLDQSQFDKLIVEQEVGGLMEKMSSSFSMDSLG